MFCRLLEQPLTSLPPRDGFNDTATLEGDPTKATAHLKTMTSKMAESKRLIKEYERVCKESIDCDETKVAASKKEMVQKLNQFVNKKKAAQADVAARVANTVTDGVSGAAQLATAAGTAATVATLASRVGADGSSGSRVPDPSAAKLFEGAKAAVFGSPNKEGKQQAAPEEVNLQVMELQDVMQVGRDNMDATDQAIERSKKTVETTIILGQQTAEALRRQTEQMERVVDDLDEIHFSLKKSFKVIRDLTRGLATDKCILTLLFLVVAGVVSIIVVKIAGVDGKDEVIDVDPLSNQDTPSDSSSRRMMRKLLFQAGSSMSGWE